MFRTTIALAALLLAAQLSACGQPPAESAVDANEERNKEIVIAFYNAAINDKDFEAASAYLGDKYIQHNPLAADGPEGLRTFLEFAKENMPGIEAQIVEVEKLIKGCDGKDPDKDKEAYTHSVDGMMTKRRR